jgi:hypothetical protein
MGELDHDQRRVGRPSLAFSRPVLGEYRRCHCHLDLALSPSDRRFSVRSVTCMHALLWTLTLMDMGARGMGELDHDRERVGRPGLAFSRPKTSRKHREQHDPTHAWLSVIYGDGLSEADGYRGAYWSSLAPNTRFWGSVRS